MSELANQVAQLAAVATLICIMLGVGLSLPTELRKLPGTLSLRELRGIVVVNYAWVPAWGAALALLNRQSQPGLSMALLLFACLPAGPISLLFVSPRPEPLARSTATVLWLQLLSVVLSPPLLLVCGWLVLGRSFLGPALPALLSLSVQILLLELLPISLGLWLRRKWPDSTLKARIRIRQLASASLLVAGAGFLYVFQNQLASGDWLAGVIPFVALPLGAWFGAGISQKGRRVDGSQIAGLRNISLALVLASSAPQAQDAVLFVLVGALVTTLAAPILRFVTRQRKQQPARAG